METACGPAALHLPLEQGQLVVPLQSGVQVINPAVAALLSAHQVKVMDPEYEPIGRFPSNTLNRKFCYCGANSDLVILLGDDHSPTMKTFHELLSIAGREHLMAPA